MPLPAMRASQRRNAMRYVYADLLANNTKFADYPSEAKLLLHDLERKAVVVRGAGGWELTMYGKRYAAHQVTYYNNSTSYLDSVGADAFDILQSLREAAKSKTDLVGSIPTSTQITDAVLYTMKKYNLVGYDARDGVYAITPFGEAVVELELFRRSVMEE